MSKKDTNSHSSKKSSDQKAIQAGEKLMLDVNESLNSVLNELGELQTSGLTAESEALTQLLSAESNLSNATTVFAGPSPKFDAPTWEGSDSNPKRASYEKEFTPVITKCLTAPTVQSDELAIAAQLLEGTIKTTFQQQAGQQNLTETGDGFPSDLSVDTVAMQWVADSIIRLSGNVAEDVQTKLANDLIAKVTKMTAKQLYENLKLPDYWQAVTSLESNGGYNDVVGEIEAAIAGMWSTYGNAKNLTEDVIANATASIITDLKATKTQEALTALSPLELQSVKDRITNIPSPLPSPKPAKNKNYEIVETAIAKFQKDIASNIPKATGTATWDGDFGAIVENALLGSSATHAAAVLAKQNKILNALENNYNTLPRNPLNPSAPISDETEITTWIESTVSTLRTKKVITSTQGDLLNSGLIDEVMRLFPIPDKISFYQTFQDNLSDSLLNLPELNSNKQGSSDNSSTKSSENGQVTADGSGLRHAISSQLSGSSLQDAAQKVTITADKPNKIAAAIATTSSVNDLNAICNELSHTLTAEVESIVQKAIENVFVSLSEQGVQGQMISSSYDYQLIKRITSYTNTLLTQLDKHYDVDVPENKDDSIKAAQSVTAASVSYSKFVKDLVSLNENYKLAEDTANPQSGGSTSELNLYFKGNKSSGAQPTWAESLISISDAIYGSSSNKEALILESEYDAVQLAANAASFSSKLDDEFIQERSNAEAALNNLKNNTEQLFSTTQTSYNDLSDVYFNALEQYTQSKESYEIDEAVNTAYNSALAGLFQIMETSNIQYGTASLATI